MTTEVLMRARKGILYPIDGKARQAIVSVPRGALLRVSWKRARSVKHHRKFFGLLDAVFEAQDQFATRDGLLDAIKIHLGHYTTGKIGDQKVFIPKSIAFDAMDQGEFNDFYRAAVRAITEYILPGVESEELLAHVHSIMDSNGG